MAPRGAERAEVDDDGGRPRWVRIVWRATDRMGPNAALLYLTAAILLILVVAWLRSSESLKLSNTSAVGTIAALFLTIYIFAWTLKSSDRTDRRLGALAQQFGQAVATQPTEFAEPDAASADDVPEEYTADPPLAPHEPGTIGPIVVTVGDYRMFSNEEIPMRVIRDLVSAWEHQGLDGRWVLGELQGAFRKQGRGNHSWYLAFPARRVLWKVSRGGQAQPEPTAQEIPLQREADGA